MLVRVSVIPYIGQRQKNSSGPGGGNASGHRAEALARLARLVSLNLVETTSDGMRLRRTVEEFGPSRRPR